MNKLPLQLLTTISIFSVVILPAKIVKSADAVFSFRIESSGTAPFDQNNNPGNDDGAANNIIRTQDVITYKWEYNVSNGAANNVILKATVPDNVELSMPAVCNNQSQISIDANGGQLIECKINSIASGSSGSIDLKARILGRRRNTTQTFVGNGDITNATGSISASNLTNTVALVTTSNLIISAIPKTDIYKQSAYVEGVAKGEDGITDGLVVRYPIVTSITGGGKGGEALVGNINFTDTLVYNGGTSDGQQIPGVKLYTWRPGYVSITPGSNSSCNRLGGDPWAYYGTYPNGKINSSYYPAYGTAEWSTTDSGTWTCNQSAPGQPINFTISGADTTGSQRPTKDYYGGNTLPIDQSYLTVGALHLWVPISAITANGGQLNVRNKITGFTATGSSGQANQDPNIANNYYDHTLVSTSGAFTTYYSTDVDNRGTALPGQSAIYGGDGAVMPTQTFAARAYLNNSGALPWAATSILCTAIDNKIQIVTPLADDPNSAVRNFSSAGLGTDYVIEYGTGNYASPLDHKRATCRDVDSPGGWHSNLQSVPGGIDAISKVRVRAINPIAPGFTWDIAVNLKARNTYLNTTQQIPVGTRLVQHGSFFIPDYPNVGQGETGMPVGWYGGYYQPSDNYYAGWGDRLTLTRAIVRIDKQNTPDQPVVNAAAGSQVTFTLKPTITAGISPAPVNPNVTVRDILPATMNYVTNSANITPESVTVNSDGKTTIIWNLGSRIPNQSVPDITYRASIRPDTPNNATVINTAMIESSDDGSLEQYRTDIASVNVGNAASFQIFKEVDREIIDQNSQVGYSLYYANTGSSDVGTSQYIDILPYSNDSRIPATNYAGSLVFSSIVGTNGETYEFTNRPHAQINSDPLDSSNQTGGATMWCSNSSFGINGCPNSNSDVNAIRINASAFPKNQPTRKLTLKLNTSNNQPNNIYTNKFTGRANGLLGLLISNEVSARVRIPAQLLLVKRITAINNVPINTEVKDTVTQADKHPNWAANYLKGAINGGVVKPGDKLEYTIYFMSAGDSAVRNLIICDRIEPNQSFLPSSYSSGVGIQLKLGLDSAINLTSSADSIDRGQLIPSGVQPLGSCNIPTTQANTDGVVVVGVTGNSGIPTINEIPGATSPGNPRSSFGLIRFTTKID